MRSAGHLERLAVLGGAVSVVGLGSGCASIADLDDGAGEAGMVTVRDARAHDVGSPDVTLDAGGDAASDALDGPPGSDARADAAADAPCVPFAPPDAGPLPATSCSTPPVGQCAPVAIPSFVPVAHPPKVVHGACSAAQIEEIVDACFGADTSSCQSAVFNSANTTCYECMVTSAGSASYGPVINGGEVEGLALNTAGCIALVDPCQAACASAAEAEAECELATCGGVCGADDFDACTTLATECTCAAYESAYEDCYLGALSHAPAVTTCISATTDMTTLTKGYVTLFCGAVDAG